MSASNQLDFGFWDDLPSQVPFVETDEAYTTDSARYPILRTVSGFFGGIGLDPTSNPEKSVPARHHFTREDNSLTRSWADRGAAFMNPPYSKCLPFIEKMVEEYHCGNMPEGITLILTTQATNRKVGPTLRASFSAFCLIFGRPPFRFGASSRKGEFGTLTVPSVLFYIGPRPSEFCEHFMRLGTTAYTHPLDRVLQEDIAHDNT